MPSNLKRMLSSSDARLRLVEEKFDVGTWTWDIETSEVSWSPGLFRILGLDPAVSVPTIDLYQSLVHPDDQLDFSDAIGLASDRRLKDRTYRVIRPDGSLRWLRSKGQPYFDRAGNPVAMHGVAADVTHLQELEANLEEAKTWRAALARLLDDHIWRAYPDGKLVETTEWSKLTGQSPAEARDWEQLSAIHPDDRQHFLGAWEKAISTGLKFEVTIRVRDVSGQFVTLTGRAVPIRDEQGKIREWVGHTIYKDEALLVANRTGVLQSAQIRAARALLGWPASQLAEAADVSFSTVRRIETSTEALRPESLDKVRQALERAGIVFGTDSQGGISLGLRATTRRP